ncbi:cation diffusion facilitator family transporter [Acidobacteriota bacterium]
MEKTEKASLLSSLTSLLLVGFKFFIAILSGSIALKADAVHSFSDAISSLAVFAGLKISKRKFKKFPYGFHKVENLISLFISFFIFWAGYEIVKEVIFASPQEIKKLPLAILVAGASFCVSFLLSIYKIKVGTKTNSPSLLADGSHSRTDAFSSLIVLVGLSGHLIGLQIEKIAAVIVVLFILKSGYGILIESLKVLLDASLDYQTLDQIRKTIEEEKRVAQIKTLIGRNSGRYRFVEADLILKVKELEKASHIVASLEQKIKKEIPFIDSIRIHYEPVKKTILKYAVPLASPEGQLSDHFGKAPYFALFEIDVKKNNILRQEIVSNPFLAQETGKGISVAEDLTKREVDYLILKEKFGGKGPQYVLADSSIEITIMKKNTLLEILTELKIEN